MLREIKVASGSNGFDLMIVSSVLRKKRQGTLRSVTSHLHPSIPPPHPPTHMWGLGSESKWDRDPARQAIAGKVTGAAAGDTLAYAPADFRLATFWACIFAGSFWVPDGNNHGTSRFPNPVDSCDPVLGAGSAGKKKQRSMKCELRISFPGLALERRSDKRRRRGRSQGHAKLSCGRRPSCAPRPHPHALLMQ